MLCLTVSTVISGLTQLARFELNGANGKDNYHDFKLPTILINLTGVSVILAMIVILIITFMFKRRQAHDLPVLFKIILLITQFVEIVLILVVAEYIFQVVTPHVNKVMSGELLANSTITHFFNNATQSINTFIANAKDQLSLGGSSSTTTPTGTNDTIVVPIANLTSSQ